MGKTVSLLPLELAGVSLGAIWWSSGNFVVFLMVSLFNCERDWPMLGSERVATFSFSPLTWQDLSLSLKRLGVPEMEWYGLEVTLEGDTVNLLVLPSGHRTLLRCILRLAVIVGKGVCLVWCAHVAS